MPDRFDGAVAHAGVGSQLLRTVLAAADAAHAPQSADARARAPEEPIVLEPAALIAECLSALLLEGWTLEQRDGWTLLTPAVPLARVQGWKLHVAATILSAAHVLARCLPVLVDVGVQFKFASTREDLTLLNDLRFPRGRSGKFLTVYPRADADVAALAGQLHAATAGLSGPAILSDARYCDGSLVHCRYGAFDGVRTLSHDGRYRSCIIDAHGAYVEDVRGIGLRVPDWTASPWGACAREGARPHGSALLNGRYAVATAIRHANKGGVYQATDTETGAHVVIKEARPHVGTDARGRDATDMLRHEAIVLRRLAPLRVTPRVVEEFEQEGHRFLVQERIDGTPLRAWVEAGDALRRGVLVALAGALARALDAVHHAGVIVRDFGPNNVILSDEGAVFLVDLEMAALRDPATGGHVLFGEGGGTPGVSAPEQFRGAPPDVTADHYALGATLFFVATRTGPLLAASDSDARTAEARLAALLAPPLHPGSIPRALRRTLLGLMREDPHARTSAREVAAWSARQDGATRGPDLWRTPTTLEATTRLRELGDRQWTELVNGAVLYLSSHRAASDALRFWPETAFGEDMEPCAVQHGLAGVLAAVTRLRALRDDVAVAGLQEAMCARILGHLRAEPHRLPGLFFGASGIAWALFDAGMALGREDVTERALALASSLPTAWPNPDVAHGLAGLGTCLLHLAERSGRADLLERALVCAREILRAADRGPGGPSWRVPEDFDSELAGYRSYGFAHGTAGIGAFLLAAGLASGEDELLVAAQACGEALLASATVDRGGAWWPATPGGPPSPAHWCNGASGIGTFLCRLYAATGEGRLLRAAEAAAVAVMATRWRLGTPQCHGLAGNGEFLLDLARASGDARYRAWAGALGGLLWARRVYWNGAALVPDETGTAVTGGYGTGTAGHLAFLVRLRDGGPRLFHLDAGPPSANGARRSP